MKKKLIQQLAESSFENGKLSEDIALEAVKRLGRSDLKTYLAELKKIIRNTTIIIESAYPVSSDQQEMIRMAFHNKHVIFKVNPALLSGIKIIDNDLLYEANLQSTFKNIIHHIEQSYER